MVKSKKINQLLRKVREERGFSQAEIARKMGFTPQYLSNIENGKCTVSYPIVSKLSQIYDLNTDYIVSILLREYKKNLLKQLKIQ